MSEEARKKRPPRRSASQRHSLFIGTGRSRLWKVWRGTRRKLGGSPDIDPFGFMLMPALIVGIVIMIRVVVSWEVVEGFWNIFPDKEERALEDIDRWGEQKHDLLIAALTREDYLYGNACFALALLPEFDSPELRDKLVQALNEQKGDRDYLSIALCILGDERGSAQLLRFGKEGASTAHEFSDRNFRWIRYRKESAFSDRIPWVLYPRNDELFAASLTTFPATKAGAGTGNGYPVPPAAFEASAADQSAAVVEQDTAEGKLDSIIKGLTSDSVDDWLISCRELIVHDSPALRAKLVANTEIEEQDMVLSLLHDERGADSSSRWLTFYAEVETRNRRDYGWYDPIPERSDPLVWVLESVRLSPSHLLQNRDVLGNWRWRSGFEFSLSVFESSVSYRFPKGTVAKRFQKARRWHADHIGTPVLDWDFEYLDSDEDRTRGTEFNFIYSRSWFERHRIPVLLKMLKDEPNPMLKEHMAVKLFRRGMVEAIPTLDAAAKTKTEPLAQRRMMTFLVNCVEYLPVPDNPDWDYEPGGFQRSEESGFRDYIPPHWRDKITPEEAAAISRDYAEVLKWWDFNRDRIEYENGLWVVGKNK